MMIYAIKIIPLILRTVEALSSSSTKNTKAAWYSDDFFGAGTIKGLRKMWTFIESEGSKYGYYQEATKSWLIVKEEILEEARRIFADTNVQIRSEGQKHLGAVIGSRRI